MVAHCFSGMASMIFRSRSSYGAEGAALMADFEYNSANFGLLAGAVVRGEGADRATFWQSLS